MAVKSKKFKDVKIGEVFIPTYSPYKKITKTMGSPLFQIETGRIVKKRFKPDDLMETIKFVNIRGHGGGGIKLNW